MELPSKRRLFLSVGLPLALLGSSVMIPWDTPPPPESLEQAERLVQQAEIDKAGLRLPEKLTAAREAVTAAGRALAAENRRLPLLRHYDDARLLIQEAETRARQLMDETRRLAESQRATTASLLQEAETALRAAQAAADAAYLQAPGRQALQKAEIALGEARSQYDRASYEDAAATARGILEDSRHWLQVCEAVLQRLHDRDRLQQWLVWVDETVDWSRQQGAAALVVDKAARRLTLYDSGRQVQSFPVELGLNPIADKLMEGDNATPEGKYKISQVKDLGETSYYRAFLIDYPNAEDWQEFRRARSAGRIPQQSLIGGLIEIHGEGGRGHDWTNGCVALSNEQMDYLATQVEAGTPVTIVGATRAPAADSREVAAP